MRVEGGATDGAAALSYGGISVDEAGADGQVRLQRMQHLGRHAPYVAHIPQFFIVGRYQEAGGVTNELLDVQEALNGVGGCKGALGIDQENAPGLWTKQKVAQVRVAVDPTALVQPIQELAAGIKHGSLKGLWWRRGQQRNPIMLNRIVLLMPFYCGIGGKAAQSGGS